MTDAHQGGWKRMQQEPLPDDVLGNGPRFASVLQSAHQAIRHIRTLRKRAHVQQEHKARMRMDAARSAHCAHQPCKDLLALSPATQKRPLFTSATLAMLTTDKSISCPLLYYVPMCQSKSCVDVRMGVAFSCPPLAQSLAWVDQRTNERRKKIAGVCASILTQQRDCKCDMMNALWGKRVATPQHPCRQRRADEMNCSRHRDGRHACKAMPCATRWSINACRQHSKHHAHTHTY